MPNISWGEDLAAKGEYFTDYELIFELNMKEYVYTCICLLFYMFIIFSF